MLKLFPCSMVGSVRVGMERRCSSSVPIPGAWHVLRPLKRLTPVDHLQVK